jgi:deaminated glutathione amidase
MNSPSTKLRVSVLQISAGNDVSANIGRLKQLVSRLEASDLIALPEVFAVRGSDQDYRSSAQPLPGPLTNLLASVAHRHNAWVLAGSVIEAEGGKLYNTSVLLNRRGEIAASYRKMHLFEAELETGQVIRESDTYAPGDRPVMVNVEGWLCGMAICYDLRFPELFRHYSAQGAHLFFIPSNFTQRTGRDHWEVLLRARAIENQCFVLAPDQSGVNPRTGIESHGHSMVVGPWGEILCEAEEDEDVLTVVLDPQDLQHTRHRIPALKHRKL